MSIFASFQLFFLINFFVSTHAQTDPIITKWKKSTGFGWGGIQADIDLIQYSNTAVYVHCNSIPSYSIGPWYRNPNNPVKKDFTFKFSRNPQEATMKTDVGLGHIGIFLDGVSIYNADDAQSYNNLGVWKRNALFWEGPSFDACKGHPGPNGEYHNHVNPVCLYNATDASKHSTLIGYVFDSFPVYGPFGYSDPNNPSSPIKRIKPSYRLRNIVDRTTKPDGTLLTSIYYGPAISSAYPLGSFIQDYEFVQNLGDLDVNNGRWTKTPEYPNGIYAYFIATTDTGESTYPFVVGPKYNGVVERLNIGPTSGTAKPNEPVTEYFKYVAYFKG